MRYFVEELQQFATDCLMRADVPEADARWCAEALVRADLAGNSTHGMSRLKAYLHALQCRKINPRPQMVLENRAAAVSVLDGDNGLGPCVSKAAMQEAIRLAKRSGIGIVTVRRGNHAGMLSLYVELASAAGMIGWAFSNAQPAIPPWGGKAAFFGTNPIAFGAPCAAHEPVLIDLATSVAARGNIIMAAKTGQSIPLGWAIDPQGRPTTDAQAALAGAVLPMAEAKGYALALMVEILSGVLSGAAVGPQVGSVYDRTAQEPGTGLCFLAIDPTPFLGAETFGGRMDQLVDDIHHVPPAEGQLVRVPGERRHQTERMNRAEGVLLEESTLAELRELAAELDLLWRG